MPKLKTDKPRPKGTPRKLTGNRGASETRAEIKNIVSTAKRKHLRLWSNSVFTQGVISELCQDIVDRIDGMAPRANAKPGGLGRKWTAKKKGSKPNRTGQK